MRGILIFDHLNDVLFAKCNRKFANHVQRLAKLQGLLGENSDDEPASTSFKPSPNIIMQLFAPIVTSQHVMASQFGNTYTSMKCHDGTNMVFDEFMGHTFVYVSSEETELMRRTLGMCVTIVKHLCGPDVSLLKASRKKVVLVSHLLDAWYELRGCEQSILTEAVEQLSVNHELASATLKILSDAAADVKAQSEFANVHALVLVEHKFFSLFSSKHAQDLLASDILLMILLCHVANRNKARECDTSENYIIVTSRCTAPGAAAAAAAAATAEEEEEEEDFDERFNRRTSRKKLAKPTTEDINVLFEGSVNEGLCAPGGLYSQLVLLGSKDSGYTANAIHISDLADGINLVIIVEMTNAAISSGLYDSFFHLSVINGLQLQRDFEELRPAFDNLEAAVKRALDGLKRSRGSVCSGDVDMCQRRMQAKWEQVRRRYAELTKSRDAESILQIESSTNSFAEDLRELFRLTCLDRNFLKLGADVILTVSRLVGQKLNDFGDFLKIKALKNFTIGSYTSLIFQIRNSTRTCLTINKYLEEFPGLVHFIYIDRTTHRLTAPTIDFTNAETLELTTKKIWTMVEQSRVHLQEGHMSIMWKDTIFNYAYFLWFEDSSGTPLKCKTYYNHALKNLNVPGILCGDYYRKLAEAYFPKLSPSKIRIYELYCVHLGLATSSCVLEHSRRLAATIWEVTGLPNNPADLL